MSNEQHRKRKTNRKQFPLVYSCSGCSNVAQMANALALRLDRAGIAEMSCIAGVGGGVKPLVNTAQSGRPVIALDGCPLHCVAHCLANCGVVPDVHVDFSKHGFRKKTGIDSDPALEQRAWNEVVLPAISNQMNIAREAE